MAIMKSKKVEEQKTPVTTPSKTEAPAVKKPVVKKGEEAPVQGQQEIAKVVKAGRKELAAAIRQKVMAANAAVSAKVAEMAVIALEEAVIEFLAQGRQVALLGFGTFTAVPKAEQTRPNPQKADEMITIPAHIAPRFKAGKQFKTALNPKLDINEDEGE